MELPDAVFPSHVGAAGNSDWVQQTAFADFETIGFDDVNGVGDSATPQSCSLIEVPKVLFSSSSGGPSATGPTFTERTDSSMPLITIVEDAGGEPMLNSPIGTDAVPLIVVDEHGKGNVEAHRPSLPLPVAFTEGDACASVASLSTDWQVDHLFAANTSPSANAQATNPNGTIGRLGLSFAGGTTREPSPVHSASSHLSSTQAGNTARSGESDRTWGLTVPAVRDEEPPLELRVVRFRNMGYALCAGMALVLGLVTVSLSALWEETPQDRSLFWTAVPVAFGLNAFVVEAVVLGFCVLHRWFTEDVDADASETPAKEFWPHLLSLLRRRHPYEGELLFSAVEQ